MLLPLQNEWLVFSLPRALMATQEMQETKVKEEMKALRYKSSER